MKKIIMCFVLTGLLVTCAGLDISKKPSAKIERFDIESISLTDVTFLFDIAIINPYPIGLKLDGIDLAFKVEKKQLLKTSTSKGLVIRGNGKGISTFKVNLKYKDIMKIVKAYSKKDYLNCVVDVVIRIPLPKVPGLQRSIAIPYKLKKKIPAIKPSIKIARFKVDVPSVKDIKEELKKKKKEYTKPKKIFGMFKKIIKGKKPKEIINPKDLDLKFKVHFDIVLKNNTKAKLKFSKLDYKFFVNDTSLVNGITKDIKQKGNKSILRVTNEFSSKALGKSIVNAFKKKKGKYKLKGFALIQLPRSIKEEPLKLEFDESGAFKLR